METEKLELWHLCSYLPYGLKVLHTNWQEVLEMDATGSRNNCLSIEDVAEFAKPILRPLSDFGVEVTFGNNTFKSDEYIATSIKDSQLNHRIINEHSNCDRLEQWKFERLCQMHFDVFGLIDKGLAISIHDINK